MARVREVQGTSQGRESWGSRGRRGEGREGQVELQQTGGEKRRKKGVERDRIGTKLSDQEW